MNQVRNVKAIKYSSYVPLKSPDKRRVGMGARVAHFLVWVAAQDPNEVVPFARIAQSVLSLEFLPRSNERDVSKIKDALTSAAKVLRDEHQKDLVQETGIGCRVSKSDDDVVRNVLAKKVRRRESVDRTIGATRAVVDSSKVTDPANKAIVRFADNHVLSQALLKQREEILKLLPSGSKRPEEKK